MESYFPSKRDAWLVVVIWASGLLLLGTAWIPLATGALGAFAIPVSALHLAGAGLGFWVLYGTGYRIGERALHVRGGPFRWTIALDSIVAVTPTGNPLSSPACSLDRLCIEHRGARGVRSLMISPTEKAAFLVALAARCPELVLAGDRLVPKTRAGYGAASAKERRA